MRKLFLLILLLPVSLWGYDFQAGHLFYNVLSDSTVEVCCEHPGEVALYGRLRKLTIPSSVSHDSLSYTVIGIGKRAFHDCPKLRRIRLPESLLYIDSAAFEGLSSLDSLTLPSRLARIADNAFQNCTTLGYIDLPASTDSIGENVFTGCTRLRRLTVDPLNERYDSPNGCNGVVERATGKLFATCTRTSIPDKLKEIGTQAFAYRSNIEQALIPEGVERIGYAAFAGCIALDTVSLPSTLDSLGEWAFYGCQSLRHIALPESLQTIPYNCFAECNDLREIALPERLDSLANQAFYFSGIRTARLNRVRVIGERCFAGCRFLRAVYLSGVPEFIDPSALENCPALEAIYVPAGQRKRVQKMLPKLFHKIIIEH